MKEYAIVIHRGEPGQIAWGATVPDLPGCVSVGDTLEELKANIREAIELHLEGLAAEGLPVPEPTSQVSTVAVAA
jgi:predicted RNase H-like HicB family nuclease